MEGGAASDGFAIVWRLILSAFEEDGLSASEVDVSQDCRGSRDSGHELR